MTSKRLTNAALGDGLAVRVGVPHFNGKLPAHCSEQDYPVMISAGAFWSDRAGRFAEPGRFGWTADACDVALDSAGFVAMRRWAAKGQQAGLGSVFPWTLTQYLQLVADVRPAWWSAPDACCEPEIAGDAAEVSRRVRLTDDFLQQCLATTAVLSRQMGWHLRPPVPILQGWRPADYLESLRRTLATWRTFTAGTQFERSPTLMGIGSVCRRKLEGESGLYRVLDAVCSELPSGVSLHLFGVKGAALSTLDHFPAVRSVDSMAYDFRARMAAATARTSNTFEHRIAHMDAWLARNRPGHGAQPILPLKLRSTFELTRGR